MYLTLNIVIILHMDQMLFLDSKPTPRTPSVRDIKPYSKLNKIL